MGWHQGVVCRNKQRQGIWRGGCTDVLEVSHVCRRASVAVEGLQENCGDGTWKPRACRDAADAERSFNLEFPYACLVCSARQVWCIRWLFVSRYPSQERSYCRDCDVCLTPYFQLGGYSVLWHCRFAKYINF